MVQRIAEYFTFTSYSTYYDYSAFSEEVCPSIFVNIPANNACVAIVACQNRAQMNKKTIGKEVCTEDLVGMKLFYSVGENFNIRRLNVYITGDKFSTLFEDIMTGNGVRDNVCNVLMSDSCKETARLNNINTTGECESKYDALPATQKDGHIDQNSKGCRILHAAFAESNQEHCPHLSFIPQKDSKGRTKCEEGDGLLYSDLFLDTDLKFYEKAAADLNYSSVTFSKRCEYDPSRSTKDSGTQSLLLSGFVYSVIGAVALFSW